MLAFLGEERGLCPKSRHNFTLTKIPLGGSIGSNGFGLLRELMILACRRAGNGSVNAQLRSGLARNLSYTK